MILISLIVFLIIDYNRSFYGKGFNIFRHKITYDLNTDFDSLEGFKIEEEGFIQVIGQGTKLSNKAVVKQITNYSYDSNGIYCEILDNNNKKYFVKVIYDEKRPWGQKMSYDVVSKHSIDKNLKWYNVEM